MKNKQLLLLLCLFLSIPSFAQKEKMTREDKDEKNQARQDRINYKNDVVLFRKQILGLKEYNLERQKIPALQKLSKMPVKVLAIVDTNENDVDTKTLLGSIRQDVGDNSTTMYELTYDRAKRMIVSAKRTPEAIDADKELVEEKEEKATTKKTVVRKTTTTTTKTRKTGDEDEEDEPDEEKPAKGKKDKDDDDE